MPPENLIGVIVGAANLIILIITFVRTSAGYYVRRKDFDAAWDDRRKEFNELRNDFYKLRDDFNKLLREHEVVMFQLQIVRRRTEEHQKRLDNGDHC